MHTLAVSISSFFTLFVPRGGLADYNILLDDQVREGGLKCSGGDLAFFLLPLST